MSTSAKSLPLIRDEQRADGHKLDVHPHWTVKYLDNKDDWEGAKRIPPLYVEIGPVSVCNHECTFCGVDYMLDRSDRPHIALPIFQRLLTDLAQMGTKGVMFAGAGEPFLYKGGADGKKGLADVVLHASNVGLHMGVTTNAVLFKEEVARRALGAEGLRWVRTSIHGGDAATYAAIHQTRPEDFETVLRNLAKAAEIRQQIGSKTRLEAVLVAVPEAEGRSRKSLMRRYPSNLPTIAALARRLREAGVDILQVKPYTDHLAMEDSRARMYRGIRYDDRGVYAEAEAEARVGFEVVVRHATMDRRDAVGRDYDRCRATPYVWAYVEADGFVHGCSAHLGRIDPKTGADIGGNPIFRFGNLNEQGFREIWEGERRKACWEYTRRSKAEGGLDLGTCMLNCQMDKQNRYLHELVNPEHTRNLIK